MNSKPSAYLQERVFTLGLLTLALFVACSLIWPDTFFTFGNLSTLFLNISTDAIIAVGMMILLISGTFDLSVGSVYALSGGFAAWVIYFYGAYTPTAVLAGLAVALLIGLVNGLFIAKVGINPLIQTLAMMGIGRGLFDLIGKVAVVPESFEVIGTARILGLQMPVWLMAVTLLLFGLLLSRSVYFRRYFFIGGNEKAARLAGIRVDRMKIAGFVLSAFLAGLAGIIYVSRLGAVPDSLGKGLELKIITAVILGGASLLGGQGSIFGAFLGVVFTHLISNILVFARVSGEWTDIIFGIILILAIALDLLLKRRAEAKAKQAVISEQQTGLQTPRTGKPRRE